MATKDEMGAELAELGREVEVGDYSWEELDRMLREARDSSQETPEVADGELGPETVDEASEVVQEPSSQTKYSVGQLKRYSELVMGVDNSLVVGAQSAGVLPGDDELMTISEATELVRRYERGD